MSNKKEIKILSEATHDKWQKLIERYFDATATEAEEELLKQFLASPLSYSPQYDEIKAVMSYLSTGKRIHTTPTARRVEKKRTILIAIARWSIAATIAIGLFCTATWYTSSIEENICIAYIDGKKYTEETIVLAQMRQTMKQMHKGIEEHSPKQQLGNIFHTINSYNNNI